MQLAIDGLIALVVVVSHLVILARMAYLDVFTYRYIPYVIVVTAVKWLAKVLWQIDIPDAIYLLGSTRRKVFLCFLFPCLLDSDYKFL